MYRKNGKKLNIAHEIARQAIEYLTMCDRRVFISFEINKLVVIFIGDVVVVVLWLYFIKMYPKWQLKLMIYLDIDLLCGLN